MNRKEIKIWSKDKIKGKIWKVLPAIFVASIITNLSFFIDIHSTRVTLPVGSIIFYFVEVGLTLFMINFITDKEYKIDDLFTTSKEIKKYMIFGLVKYLYIFLWTLLFIIPGIIKSFAYSMSDLLLLDEKYKDLKETDILKKSEEIMKGHKGELFLLELSFIGWHILAIFTLFILEIWIVPYEQTAKTKYLYNLKNEYENNI